MNTDGFEGKPTGPRLHRPLDGLASTGLRDNDDCDEALDRGRVVVSVRFEDRSTGLFVAALE